VTGELRFDGRVAVVTGGGSGIGAAHARLLAGRGAAVVVNDVDEAAAGGVVEAVQAAGGRAVPCVASVAAEAGAAAIVAAAIEGFGRLDIVLNNAGLLRSAPITELSISDWNEILAVSLTGSLLVTRAAWPYLAAQRYGRVVMTTSNSGLLGIPGSAAYASAKAGLWGLIRVLAIEGEEVGVTVNGLAPMAFTAMSVQSKVAPKAWRDGTGDDWSRRLDVDLVSPVAAWLCHETCQVSGEVLSAAGGRVARFFMGLTEGFDRESLTVEDVAAGLDTVLDTGEHRVLRRAFEEGRDLHRRLLPRRDGS
jgi:NAD(P)-dependent dehydrogenase (short-subunit alcohol dehydrogenase family)